MTKISFFTERHPNFPVYFFCLKFFIRHKILKSSYFFLSKTLFTLQKNLWLILLSSNYFLVRHRTT